MFKYNFRRCFIITQEVNKYSVEYIRELVSKKIKWNLAILTRPYILYELLLVLENSIVLVKHIYTSRVHGVLIQFHSKKTLRHLL